jgi:hypothetical protein
MQNHLEKDISKLKILIKSKKEKNRGTRMKYNDKTKIYLGRNNIYKNRHIPSNNKANQIPDKNSDRQFGNWS